MPEEKPKQSLGDRLRGLINKNITPATSTESTSPTAGITPKSTPTVSTGVWDSQIAPLIKTHHWEDNFDETKTELLPALKKVLNGEYNQFESQLDKDIAPVFKKFKTSAENYKNMLINIDKGVKVTKDEQNKISLAWQADFQDFAKNVIRPTGSNPGLDPKTFNMMSHRTYLKKSDTPFLEPDKSYLSTTVKYNSGIIDDIFGGSRNIEDAGYTKLSDWESDYKSQIDKNVSAVITSWSDLSFENINKPDNTNYKIDVYNYVKESLNTIVKYGANTNDETVNDSLKRDAENTLNLMKGKSLDEAITIIKTNQEDITPLLTNTGYINKVTLFNKFIKEGIGTNNLFYKSDGELDKAVNAAKAAITYKEYYNSQIKDYKDGVKNHAKSIYKSNGSLSDVTDDLFDAVVNEFGDIRSKEEFKKIIKSKKDIEIPFEQKGVNQTNYNSTLVETSDGKRIPLTLPNVQKIPFAQYVASKNSSFFNPLPELGFRIDPQLDEVYEDIAKQYKQGFDDVKPNETSKKVDKYKNTLYTLGLGDEVAPSLYFEGVDLSLDSTKNLADKQSNIKQQNLNNLFNIIKPNSRVNSNDIVILDNDKINSGLYTYDIEDFNSDKQNNTKNYNEFFKDNTGLDFVKMSFQRYSNVDKHAYYEFTTEQNKKLGVLIPWTKLENLDGKGTGEDLYIKTKSSPLDRAFHITGEYVIPGNITDEETGKVLIKNQNIRLDQKTQNNFIYFDYLSSNGEYATQKIDVGHTSGTTLEATKKVMDSVIQQILNKEITE